LRGATVSLPSVVSFGWSRMECPWQNAMNPGRLRGATNPRPTTRSKPSRWSETIGGTRLGHLVVAGLSEGGNVGAKWTCSGYVDGGAHTRTNPMRGGSSESEIRCEGRRFRGEAKAMRDGSFLFNRMIRGSRAGNPLKTHSVTRKGHEGTQQIPTSCYRARNAGVTRHEP